MKPATAVYKIVKFWKNVKTRYDPITLSLIEQPSFKWIDENTGFIFHFSAASLVEYIVRLEHSNVCNPLTRSRISTAQIVHLKFLYAKKNNVPFRVVQSLCDAANLFCFHWASKVICFVLFCFWVQHFQQNLSIDNQNNVLKNIFFLELKKIQIYYGCPPSWYGSCEKLVSNLQVF